MENKTEEARFIAVLTTAASFVKQDLNPYIIELYVKAVKPLGFERAAKIIEEFLEKGKFATIAQIKEGLGFKELSYEENARDACARIRESVSRFGHWNEDSAKNYIGDLGWEMVMRSGGWDVICSAENYDALDFQLVQMRELGIVLQNKAAGDYLDKAPNLPRRIGLHPVIEGLVKRNDERLGKKDE